MTRYAYFPGATQNAFQQPGITLSSVYLIRKGLEKVTSVSLDSDQVDELVDGLLSEALQTAQNKLGLSALYVTLLPKPIMLQNRGFSGKDRRVGFN